MGSVPLVLVWGAPLQPGARYRELLEQFRTITVRGGPELDAIWFDVLHVDGTVMEIGRTPDWRSGMSSGTRGGGHWAGG